jgi:hypothetical protein
MKNYGSIGCEQYQNQECGTDISETKRGSAHLRCRRRQCVGICSNRSAPPFEELEHHSPFTWTSLVVRWRHKRPLCMPRSFPHRGMTTFIYSVEAVMRATGTIQAKIQASRNRMTRQPYYESARHALIWINLAARANPPVRYVTTTFRSWIASSNRRLWKLSAASEVAPIRAWRLWFVFPCSGDVRRLRGRSRRDPHRLRAAGRVGGRGRTAPAIPVDHQRAGVCSDHRWLETAAGDATPDQTVAFQGLSSRTLGRRALGTAGEVTPARFRPPPRQLHVAAWHHRWHVTRHRIGPVIRAPDRNAAL